MVVAALPSVWIERVGPVEGVDVVAWEADGAPPRADEVVYACMPYQLSADGFEHVATMPNLRFMQLLSAGYEHAQPYLPDGVALANARGVHSSATAEQALTLTLASQRDVPRWVRDQGEQRWDQGGFTPGLAGRRVLVVGYGDIGAAIVRRVLAFEPQRVTVVASRARGGDDLVDAVHCVDELPALVPEHDVVILVVPHTPATDRLVDADLLAAMPDGALLVNVARGRIVDTDALVAECAAGRLRAALDVTDPEPLPAGHPLWTTRGVLISPHTGGLAEIFWDRATTMLRGQLERLGRGEQPANVVVPADRAAS